MKTYNHLWEELISDENIREAVYNASHGAVRGKRQAILLDINFYIESKIPEIREKIENYIPAHTNDN